MVEAATRETVAEVEDVVLCFLLASVAPRHRDVGVGGRSSVNFEPELNSRIFVDERTWGGRSQSDVLDLNHTQLLL